MTISKNLYAVMGNPITHSLSPKIHALFAKQSNQNINYIAQEVDPNLFSEAVHEFFLNPRSHGLSITHPFKEQAKNIANELTPRAKLAQSVNTLWINKSNKIVGDNTDGVGFINDLLINHQINIENKKILILGAGSTVRAIISFIINQHPEKITISNRTIERAQRIARTIEFSIEICDLSEIKGDFHLIINATTSSLHNSTLPIPSDIISSHTILYDLFYNNSITSFNKWGKQQGCYKTIDGLGMLIEQAVIQFQLWRNVVVDTLPILNKLRTFIY